MKNNRPPASPVFATILLALFSSVLCLIVLVIYLILNWNNPIWTSQVKIFFGGFGLVILCVSGGLVYLYRRIIH